ncbi:MAG: hypothetical protein E6H08_17680 [Bacteroidetes bacterium]|nr:MAG: hypothetical protein E6H08_17680 [Bacteroidota bacterium]
MSSDLEKFIRKNRGDFDEADPSNKVWKNIERSIPVKKEVKHFTIRDIYKWSAAAAVFFIALTSAYFLFIRTTPGNVQEKISTVKTGTEENSSRLDNFNSISIEYATQFKQAEQAVEDRQKQLRAAIANDPMLYHKFQQDLVTLDSSYRMLREQASHSINGDVIIKAMIQNLQLQSELLGRQLMIIHEYKTTKTSTNEKNI